MSRTVLIMAAGTGGHIFPALTVARLLQSRGVNVEWLGTPAGMENRVLEATDIELHRLPVSGLRGKGALALLKAPFMLAKSLLAAIKVVRQVKPGCVLGMGGYVTGPGGLAAWLLRTPLIIHEQNAVAGTSNRLLAPLSRHVLQAFPNTFTESTKVATTGNPVRDEILAVGEAPRRGFDKGRPLRLLVLGGSQGALAINRIIPAVVARLGAEPGVTVWHQTGRDKLEEVLADYRMHGVAVACGETDEHTNRADMFIDDMARAYAWADLVICRAGAGTLTELAVAGLPSLLVPLPSAIDDHQTHNARWLADGGAAVLLPQSELTIEQLETLIAGLAGDPARLTGMSVAARSLARPDAATRVADLCMEACHG